MRVGLYGQQKGKTGKRIMTSEVIKTILTEEEKRIFEFAEDEAARICSEQSGETGAVDQAIADLFTALHKFNTRQIDD